MAWSTEYHVTKLSNVITFDLMEFHMHFDIVTTLKIFVSCITFRFASEAKNENQAFFLWPCLFWFNQFIYQLGTKEINIFITLLMLGELIEEEMTRVDSNCVWEFKGWGRQHVTCPEYHRRHRSSLIFLFWLILLTFKAFYTVYFL